MDLELKEGDKIYFIGIGGIAMSAAASLAKAAGFAVSGSDSKEIYAPAADVLKDSRISFSVGYRAEQAAGSGADLFVLSAGEDENNPEVAWVLQQDARRCGLAEFLYELSKDKLRLVVAGTHGKSTTAGLLGHLLKHLDDSSFMAGAVLQNYNRNFSWGSGHYFVFEGDEYKEQFDDPTPKFQYYRPDILVLTNLEYDHPDLFPNLAALEDEFRHLLANLPEDGLIVYNADDINLARLVNESNISSVSFGSENDADFQISSLRFEPDFTTIEIANRFRKDISSQLLGQTEQYKIQLPGKINVYNALAAIATLRALGFVQDQLALELLAYRGVKRRFELVGVKNGITLIDDYAHHPTAVRETLAAARLKYPRAKIWAVFEPHTYSRTQATLPALTDSFAYADAALISEIYPAREKQAGGGITSRQVVDAVRMAHHEADVRLVADKAEALAILQREAKAGDVIVVMAVGNFNRLAYELKEKL